jgi:hypothetical protein
LKKHKGQAIRKKLAIALHFFSIESGLRSTAQQFGVSTTKVWESVRQVSKVFHRNR